MIHTVLLEITTHCNKRCPECCAGIGINRVLKHHDWPYFERAAQLLHGIQTVQLTGGEPTVHPQFEQFVPRFRDLFGCERLAMNSNGYGFYRHATVIANHIDAIDFSHYHDIDLPNIEMVSRLVAISTFDGGINGANFTARSHRGSGRPCFRSCDQSGMIAYADGRIYPCCVAPGIAGSAYLEDAVDWRARIEHVPPPCSACWFSPEA